MRFEGFYASFSPSFHPVTHCSFTDSQGDRYVFLLPALLFQLPGLFASFFSPIGFLWCSHTSYAITLYFLLPRSVTTFYAATVIAGNSSCSCSNQFVPKRRRGMRITPCWTRASFRKRR